MTQLQKSGGQVAVRKFGISQFSTLNCFCRNHDNSVFSDIEDIPLTFAPRQIALLHYRAVASELYKKIRVDEANVRQLDIFSKKYSSGKDRGRLELFTAFMEGTKLGLRDARLALDDCEAILKSHDYDRLSACVVKFKILPSIMTVGGFFPEFDFNGRSLQKLGNWDNPSEAVSFNILASEGRAAAAIIWWKGHENCLAFARSYEAQSTAQYTTLAIQLAFEHLENTCMKPAWWDGLKLVERDLLIRRLRYAGSPSDVRQNSCLQYTGVTHDDWEFESVEFLNP